ncbi:MAG: hypothetical protein QGH15_05195 [Kiritimatiellia bacterium]|jgi:hypothetical protein|nr:hypothetical protein [Kiritimatiellia bacterium]
MKETGNITKLSWHRPLLRALALCLGVGLLVIAALAQDVPFVETFENRSEGVLHNQNSWQAYRQNDAQVQTSTVYNGSKAGTVATNTTAWRSFTNSSATNVWVDFYSRVEYPTNSTPPALTGTVAAAFFVDEDGKIRAVSNSTWVVLNYTVPSNTWQRFSVNLNYDTSKWALHIADDTPNKLSTALATNLSFSSSSTNTYFRRFRIKN